MLTLLAGFGWMWFQTEMGTVLMQAGMGKMGVSIAMNSLIQEDKQKMSISASQPFLDCPS